MKELPLGIRLENMERAALERAARADQRPLSALGRVIISDWLRKNGWLTEKASGTEARPEPAEADAAPLPR